jgi:hypothetical protein
MAKQKNDQPSGEVKKSKCEITREEFLDAAKAQTLQLGDLGSAVAVVKEFSTGSFGWNANDKVTVNLGGKAVKVQVGVNLTVVGSKGAK